MISLPGTKDCIVAAEKIPQLDDALACHIGSAPVRTGGDLGPRLQASHGAQNGCKSWETLNGGCVQLPFTHGRVVQPHWRSGGWARIRASRPREGRRPGPTSWQTAVRPPLGPRTAAELLPVLMARVTRRLGPGRPRSSSPDCDQVAKWASATTPAALYLTPASMASESRRGARDYQSTHVDLDGTIRAEDQLPWREAARVRLCGVESTTRPGRRERSAQRSALAAPYQVIARGHISRRQS